MKTIKNKSLNNIKFNHILDLTFAAIALILSAISTTIFAFFLAKIIDASINLNLKAFKDGILGAAGTIAFGGFMEYIGHNLRYKYATKTIVDYKSVLIEKILGYNFKEFSKNSTTFYLNSLTEEVNEIKIHYYLQFAAILQNIAQIIFGIVAIIYINWKFAVFIIILFLIPMIVPGLVAPVLSKRMKSVSNKNERYILIVKGILDGFEVIKTYNLIPKIKTHFITSAGNLEESQYKFSKVDNLKDALSVFASFLVQMSAIAIGVFFVFKGEMELGLLFGAIQIISGIVGPMTSLAQRMAWIGGTKSLREKHNDIMNINIETVNKGKHLNSISEIKATNLDFKYGDTKILSDIQLKIAKGKKYAVIGPSGSGKSTLLKLLMGYYDDYEGSVLIDDNELRDIKKESYYEHIVMIHQNVFLFEDTFENNIKLYRNIDDNKYKYAVCKANLTDLEKRAGNESLDVLRDGGVELSGGEKQRIAIARSLLLNTDFMLLDEPTSALDPENAETLYDTILSLEDLGVLVVTHNWDDELLNRFDQVIYMENGSLKKIGKWDDIKDR